jgi:hypothetical protein
MHAWWRNNLHGRRVKESPGLVLRISLLLGPWQGSTIQDTHL